MNDGVEQPALQVIVLGSGGGPQENNTTAFLVRSVAQNWSKGSLLAVDAGVHLAAIAKILDTHKDIHPEDDKNNSNGHLHQKRILTTGPFEGLELQYKSAKANAGYVASVLVETYLITHPHLDHISGLVVNTAGLPGTRPKRIAALPSTIEAFKAHIFNNVIWPNLSDENNGAGLITYMRLVEGGSLALGTGEGRGYVEVCEGLRVKTWSVSHGHCFERHDHRGSNAASPSLDMSPRLSSILQSASRSNTSTNFSPGERGRRRSSAYERVCVYDSSAYFIQDVATGKEILIFGDVEPDSISLSPRNRRVWTEAAPKIVSGHMKAVFIECSYDDSRTVDVLFGHLAPRFVIEELQALAVEVTRLSRTGSRKRKRESHGRPKTVHRRTPRAHSPVVSPCARRLTNSLELDVLPASLRSVGDNEDGVEEVENSLPLPEYPVTAGEDDSLQLHGLKVIIIHVKEKLDDGPNVAEIILRQILEQEKQVQLGCEFLISTVGQSLYF